MRWPPERAYLAVHPAPEGLLLMCGVLVVHFELTGREIPGQSISRLKISPLPNSTPFGDPAPWSNLSSLQPYFDTSLTGNQVLLMLRDNYSKFWL